MIKNYSWFTLFELLVVIAIIWILMIWASNVNFTSQIDKQNSEMFTNNIFTSIESLRNNSLLWKWIWSGAILSYPNAWNIHISSEWTGSVQGTYTSWSSLVPINDFSVNFINELTKISELKCETIDGSNTYIATKIDIIFSWNNTSFSWCDNSQQKILKINTSYKNFNKTIKINSITWLIEKL